MSIKQRNHLKDKWAVTSHCTLSMMRMTSMKENKKKTEKYQGILANRGSSRSLPPGADVHLETALKEIHQDCLHLCPSITTNFLWRSTLVSSIKPEMFCAKRQCYLMEGTADWYPNENYRMLLNKSKLQMKKINYESMFYFNYKFFRQF